ncbi:MAG TPA: hypothetical protein VKT54_09655, partial [Steroidobacteraceae bacterium]|nr:hypothetical protein [Steroidobacteraceae bacterium]
WVVTASHDGTARIWDAATGRELAVLTGHTAAVDSARFSRDGRRIVTASHDGTARVWDAMSAQELMVLSGHAGAVLSATFSPDGARIVTASDDKTIRVWDARVVELSAQLQWARAARFDGFSGTERFQLGLAAPVDERLAHGGPQSPDPTIRGQELAQRAAEAERVAAVAPDVRDRDAALLEAFKDYAAAADLASRAGWGEDHWREWRYGRASLARVLSREGMMQQVADAYRAAGKP